MKKVVILLVALFLISCSCSEATPDRIGDLKVVTYDSCEYLMYSTYYGYYEVTHKGNCKYCEERLRELINQK